MGTWINPPTSRVRENDNLGEPGGRTFPSHGGETGVVWQTDEGEVWEADMRLESAVRGGPSWHPCRPERAEALKKRFAAHHDLPV